MAEQRSSSLRDLPRVDHVLDVPVVAEIAGELGRAVTAGLVRDALDDARDRVRQGESAPTIEEAARQVSLRAREVRRTRTQRVINATGVLLHTNLGRAPLSDAATAAVAETAGRYTALELALSTGRRGGRAEFAHQALCQLTGAEAALVVNNCAAAVLLALAAWRANGVDAAIVSRGELIEIGGGFRVPEVMVQSGIELIEVGTTNKTRASDYERALDAHPTAGLLRVHQGNFRQVGFVERPALGELAEMAVRRRVPLIKDLGGGAMVDLGAVGLSREPTVASCVQPGVSLICFSTDKVLGGPQGGAIIGEADWVRRAARHPLARAFRIGRLPLVALESTLGSYLSGRVDELPFVRAIRTPFEEVNQRAVRWASALSQVAEAIRVETWEAAIGGGALADEGVRSAGLSIQSDDAQALIDRLRDADPPVIARVVDGAVRIDARTVLPDEDELLLRALWEALRGR